jgi:hypothetical protein
MSSITRVKVTYSFQITAPVISRLFYKVFRSFLNVISSNYEQYMITNDALIPTLIVNPIESNTVYGAWFD